MPISASFTALAAEVISRHLQQAPAADGTSETTRTYNRLRDAASMELYIRVDGMPISEGDKRACKRYAEEEVQRALWQLFAVMPVRKS